MSRVSLKDIAQSADVSISLVSKVLNNRLGTTGVSPELADKIRQQAEKLHYRQNASAIALRQGRHDVIGVIIHRYGEPGSGLVENMVEGISSIARSRQKKLILNFVETDEEFLEICKSAHQGNMDGMIIGGLPHMKLKSSIARLRENGLPIVTIHDRPIHAEIPNVGIDQAAIGGLATLHLVEQGCTRIAHIFHNEKRHDGYTDAMGEAGLAVEPELLFNAGTMRYSYLAGETAATAFLDRKCGFDGIVCDSDQQAAGVINLLQERGIRVPQDVKVTGMDNAPFCEYIRPSITSISQKTRNAGELAMHMFLEMESGGRVEGAMLEPELFVRQSSGGNGE